MTTPYSRLFTVQEANELLPRLRPLVEQILENVRRLKHASETVIRREGLDPEAADLMDHLRKDDEIVRLVTQVKDWVDEINGFGCQCKGVEQGLIDFPCQFGNEVVFLCWQVGEVQVDHWHRIEDGFAGRKTLLEREGAEPDGEPTLH